MKFISFKTLKLCHHSCFYSPLSFASTSPFNCTPSSNRLLIFTSFSLLYLWTSAFSLLTFTPWTFIWRLLILTCISVFISAFTPLTPLFLWTFFLFCSSGFLHLFLVSFLSWLTFCLNGSSSFYLLLRIIGFSSWRSVSHILLWYMIFFPPFFQLFVVFLHLVFIIIMNLLFLFLIKLVPKLLSFFIFIFFISKLMKFLNSKFKICG